MPTLLKLRARRFEGIKEAKSVVAIIPAPGESVHAICTARMDLTDVLNALFDRLGRCDRMYVATLGFNAKNLNTMTRWIDSAVVGKIILLTSKLHRAHKGDLWADTKAKFNERGQRAAAADSHCKVVTLEMADGQRYWVEGSANLCGNGSGREQVMFCNGADGVEWHSKWIEDFVTRHEGAE